MLIGACVGADLGNPQGSSRRTQQVSLNSHGSQCTVATAPTHLDCSLEQEDARCLIVCVLSFGLSPSEVPCLERVSFFL